MQISVRTDTKQLERKLSKLAKKQMPYAASRAINDTMMHVKSAVMSEVLHKVDRPTDNTINAFIMSKIALKTRLRRSIELKRNARYLAGLIEGGTETKNKPVPGKSFKVNTYGNLPRKATKGKNVFYKRLRSGAEGYWKTVGGKKSKRLQMVAHIPDSRSYRPIIDFYGVARRATDRNFNRLLRKHLKSALR